MGMDFENCIKCEAMKDRLERVENGLKEVVVSVNKLEKNTAVERERVSNFANSIIKIEKGVEEIRKGLEENAKRPLNMWDKVLSAVAGGIVIYILTEIIPSFLNK